MMHLEVLFGILLTCEANLVQNRFNAFKSRSTYPNHGFPVRSGYNFRTKTSSALRSKAFVHGNSRSAQPSVTQVGPVKTFQVPSRQFYKETGKAYGPPVPTYGFEHSAPFLPAPFPKPFDGLVGIKAKMVGSIFHLIGIINGGLIAMQGKLIRTKGEIIAAKGAAIESFGIGWQHAGKAVKHGLSKVHLGGPEYQLFIGFMSQIHHLLSILFEMAKTFGVIGYPVKHHWKRAENLLNSIVLTSETIPKNSTDWTSLITSFLDTPIKQSPKHTLSELQKIEQSLVQKMSILNNNSTDIEQILKFTPFPSWDDADVDPSNNSVKDLRMLKNETIYTSIIPNYNESEKFSNLLNSFNELRNTILEKDAILIQQKFGNNSNLTLENENTIDSSVPTFIQLLKNLSKIEMNDAGSNFSHF